MVSFSSNAKEADSDPNRRDRWCWERMQAEWPGGPDDLVKAVMWAGDRHNEEIVCVAQSLDEISETLKEILKLMERS